MPASSKRSPALRLLDAVPLVGGSAVMGTGIVSVGLDLDRERTLSQILLGVAVAFWLGLSVVLGVRALRRRARLLEEARLPDALTVVAGTAVLGNRLTLLGDAWAGYLLLVLAVSLYAAFLPRVLRHWRVPTVGVSFMLTVATESLAVLAALLALQGRVAWLAVAALAPLLAGLGGYLFVLARLDLRQLLIGRGDHWVFGGALAIATLACARTTAALTATSRLPGIQHALHHATLVLWVAAMLWLPALLASELIAPRLGYDTRRWSTVFPFGMYGVCSLAAGSVTGIGDLAGLGRVCIWVALGMWTLVLAGTARRGAGLLLRVDAEPRKRPSS